MAGGESWLDELIYNRGLPSQNIAKCMGELGSRWVEEIIADNLSKRFNEIKKEGFNLVAACK